MSEQETKANLSPAERKQEERNALLVWGGEFKEKVADIEDEEIPRSLTLLDIGGCFEEERGVLTERGGRNTTPENWLFLTPTQTPESVSQTLSTLPGDTNSALENLATKIGVEKSCVLDAVIRTRVLVDNFKDRPIFLEFGKGPEGLRIGNVFAPVLLPDGRKGLASIGYVFAYYSSFETQNGVPLRSLVDSYPLERVDFLQLFPYVLLLTSFVSRKNDQS